MKYLSVNINDLERQRFSNHLLGNNCAYYYHEKFTSILGSCKFNLAQTVFIWGRRPPDIAAYKRAVKLNKNIIILQHAKNPRRESVPLNYYLSNFKKVVMWISSMGRLKLPKISNLIKVKNKQPSVHILYYTEEYKAEWQQHFKHINNINYIKCDEPCVSTFGSSTSTIINTQPINCFYVDEPLTTTLGITLKQEQKLLIQLAEKIQGKIYVKLHPRSDRNKYKGIPQFKVVDQIYNNVDFLAGYRSSLLDFNFNTSKMLRLTHEQVWCEETRINSRHVNSSDYLTQIKEYIAAYDL
jgi:hypothetical protein